MLSGLYRLADNRVLSRLAAISAEVSVLQENTNGALWIGTVGQGVFLNDGEHLSHIVSPCSIGECDAAIRVRGFEVSEPVGNEPGLPTERIDASVGRGVEDYHRVLKTE